MLGLPVHLATAACRRFTRIWRGNVRATERSCRPAVVSLCLLTLALVSVTLLASDRWSSVVKDVTFELLIEDPFINQSHYIVEQAVALGNQSEFHPTCFESPYIDCKEARTRHYYIIRKYSEKYGMFQTPRIHLTKPSAGLVTYKTNVTGGERTQLTGTGKTFRVAWMNKYEYMKDFDFSQCQFSNCQNAGNLKQPDETVDLVVVFIVGLNALTVKVPPRWPHQLYAFFSIEAPPNIGNIVGTANPWRHVFNLSISYRTDSDIFVPYNKLDYVGPSQYNTLDHLVSVAKKKTKTALWIVSNCGAPSHRDSYIAQMKKYIDIDAFGLRGACRKPCPKDPDICGQRGTPVKSVEQYRFIIAFENTFCKEYISEKIFKRFDGNRTVIPVVRGGGDYDNLFPPGTFINSAHFPNPKALALYMKQLSENPQQYAKLLMEKLQYRKSAFNWNSFHCDACEFMNKRDPDVRRHYDIQKWAKGGACFRRNDM